MNEFNLKQFLIENKLTYNSVINEEEATLDNLGSKLEQNKSFTINISFNDLDSSSELNEMPRPTVRYSMSNDWENNINNITAYKKGRTKAGEQPKVNQEETNRIRAAIRTAAENNEEITTSHPILGKYVPKLADLGIIVTNARPADINDQPNDQDNDQNNVGKIHASEGAWWSYLAEYFTGLYLLKLIKRNPVLIYEDTEDELKKGYQKRTTTTNGRKYWNSRDEKKKLRKKRMLRASSDMAKMIYDKLINEENITSYQLKIYASGEGTGGQEEKADLKIDFTPVLDIQLDPRTIGVSIKTSLNNNTSITSQPQVGRILRFISLGSESNNGKNVTPEELKKDFEAAGLYKYAIKDTIDYLINYKKTKEDFKNIVANYGIDATKSEYQTQLQWILPQIVKRTPYNQIPDKSRNKINQDFYNYLLANHVDNLVNTYKDHFSIHSTANRGDISMAQSFTRGITQSYKSADKTDEDWNKWKMMWLNWLGFGNGEWIIKSWYPNNENIPKVADVLEDPVIGPKVRQFQQDFYNDRTRLDVIYDWNKKDKTAKWTINLVDNDSNRTYAAFDCHIISTTSFQITLDLDKLDL